ncbi:hypothetical protein M413DRAFT_443143 [Hebeloma cylindrosporum]|uniref:Uncharacterized protein n=1 Tax=Hebeloma cylindrosporum TaxID=76867 RepID=A0A0C3CIV8_HEBCY|nr:hypothetical protein M413DRAFT_443143 [Hebeloma cylindrosporum h7]
MKDLSSPLRTPFALSNALNTPTASRVNHYFVDSHHQDDSVSRFDEIVARKLNEGQHHESDDHRNGSESYVDRLPNEILSLIFESGYFQFEGEREPDTAFRSLALQISQRFRQLVLHTPSLWSVIHLSPGNISRELAQLPTCLARSKEYPLEIQLRAFWNTDLTESVMDKLRTHSTRWRRLSIVAINDHILSFLQDTPAPRLEHLNISFYSHHQRTALPPAIFQGYLPLLSSVYLRNIDVDGLDFAFQGLSTLEIRGYGTWPTFSKLKETLNGSSLQRLVLHVKPKIAMQQIFDGVSEGIHDLQILLPELRTIEVYTSEWLTSGISALIRLFACPKLEDLFVRESTGSLTEAPGRTILHHSKITSNPASPIIGSTQPSPLHATLPYRLLLRSANLQFATRALSVATVSTLEIHKVYWPRHDITRDVFTSLNHLRHLLIYEHRATEALFRIFGSRDQTSQDLSLISRFNIPSLETLAIEFSNGGRMPPNNDAIQFIRLFSLPSLKSLHLKTLDLPQWKNITDAFRQHTAEYPALASLTLTNISDIIPTNPHDPFYTNIVDAFPRLSQLSLDGVSSNAFIQQLLPSPSAGLVSEITHDDIPTPLPNLRTLSIRNDRNVGTPLIHRTIIARKNMGVPLSTLYVDSHFGRNVESFEWIREHVQVGQAASEFF